MNFSQLASTILRGFLLSANCAECGEVQEEKLVFLSSTDWLGIQERGKKGPPPPKEKQLRRKLNIKEIICLAAKGGKEQDLMLVFSLGWQNSQ